MRNVSAWLRVVAAVGREPRLWPTAVRQAGRIVPSGWWHRAPFLPVPSSPYLRFRTQTQYGDATRTPVPHDVVEYLRWCRRWDRLATG